MYENDVEQMLTEFRRECIFRERIGQRRKINYENILHGTNVITINAIEQAENKFLFEKEDFKNKHIERREKVRADVCHNMNRLYQQMQNTVAEIRKYSMTDDRCKVYKGLELRDQLDRSQIDQFRSEAQQCATEIDCLNQQLNELRNENLIKMSDHEYEKSYFSECFRIVRERYEEDIKRDAAALRHLVDESCQSIAVLKTYIKKGEHILSVVGVCRKLQTEREKVVPLEGEIDVDHQQDVYDEVLFTHTQNVFK